MTCPCERHTPRLLPDIEALLDGAATTPFDAEDPFAIDEYPARESADRYGDLLVESAPRQAPTRYGDLTLEQEQDYEIIGRDARVRVQHTTAVPFRYICNLEYDIPGIGRRAICTGTLIGPRTVLTAGHCIASNGATLTPSRLRVIPGRNGNLEPLPATTATRLLLFPGYAGATNTDIGLIHLAHAIGNQVGFWSRTYRRRQGDPVGTSFFGEGPPLRPDRVRVNLAGYPGDKPSASQYACTSPTAAERRCRISSASGARHRLCGTQSFRSFDQAVRLQGGILEYLNDTCPGHSGSPVWVRRAPSMGGRVLVAVHVSGDAPGAPVANRAVLLTRPVREFIARHTR